MAVVKKYLHTIDADGNKIVHFILDPVTTAERTAVGGTLGIADEGYNVFDTDLDAQYFWDGTAWISSTSGITRTTISTVGNLTLAAAALTDYVYLVTGAHTISMPSPNSNQYTIKNNHSANITIDTAGVELIEGTTSISIAPDESVDIVSDAINWYIV